jgi:HTH-type transcriptional regulator / antitoxin HigA
METTALTPYVARPIRTEAHYKEALALIDTLIDCPDDSPEMDMLEVVSLLVHDYEQREFPISEIDPIEAIKYQMEELGVTTAEMAELVGGRSRLSELFSRKRPLSVRQIKALSTRLQLPADLLLALA